MIRLFMLAAAVAFLAPCTVVAENPRVPLSVLVTDDATASLIPTLPKGSRVTVLFRDEDEADDVIDSRAFKMRFATHFAYSSGSDSPMSAIYRERLRNHGAVVIDMRSLSQAELTRLLNISAPMRLQAIEGLSLATLAPQPKP